MTTVKYLLLALLLAGCDTSSTTDTGAPDSHQTDGGPDRGPTDGLVGENTTDQGGDAPPPPTHWELIDDTAPTVENHTVTVLKSRQVLIAGATSTTATTTSRTRPSSSIEPSRRSSPARAR